MLILDTVQGHSIQSGIRYGRITRMAIYKADSLPVGFTSSPTKLIEALADLGLPQKGDVYPHVDYDEYFLKEHHIHAVDAYTYIIQMLYEFRGILVVQDTSSLQQVATQLHPGNHEPLYVTWVNPKDPRNRTIKKIATFNAQIPLRHISASQTIPFIASGDVLAAFNGVNDASWKGLPKGYWLFSGLFGETVDDGLTYTYKVQLSTKQVEDWSQVEFLRDPFGVPVPVPPNDVKTLRNKPYDYTIDTSVNGLTKAGLHHLVDFSALFGF